MLSTSLFFPSLSLSLSLSLSIALCSCIGQPRTRPAFLPASPPPHLPTSHTHPAPWLPLIAYCRKRCCWGRPAFFSCGLMSGPAALKALPVARPPALCQPRSTTEAHHHALLALSRLLSATSTSLSVTDQPTLLHPQPTHLHPTPAPGAPRRRCARHGAAGAQATQPHRSGPATRAQKTARGRRVKVEGLRIAPASQIPPGVTIT